MTAQPAAAAVATAQMAMARPARQVRFLGATYGLQRGLSEAVMPNNLCAITTICCRLCELMSKR